ncbi:unnamed protein product [Withania somnifera]
MVKKAKRKARGGVKEKQNPVAPPNPVTQQDIQKVNAPEGGVTAVNEKKICPHIGKGVDVEKVSSKLGSSGPVRCEYCREGAANRRTGKGKGKHGKKKGGGESKSASKAIWVCLECGHFSCGGAGFPTIPQSHAVRHAKQYNHHLAVQFEKLSCDGVQDGTEQKDVLQDVVKMIKGQPSEGPNLEVEDVWFGRGSITSEIKSQASLDIGAYRKSGYVVRGLFNLGNTCFFNSIIQNLLALSRLRDYFLELDARDGPLAAAFKKFFVETSTGDGSRNAINPKSFFGSLCAKAPQFRGYQQHDSHELLHCLLDGLCTEELIARKKLKSSQDDEKSPTYVDTIFGGRLSSTVTCLECGHSSLVYEPFLDLSLPVPTKKTPSKKVQPVSRAKKLKHAPKRNGRVRPKISRDAPSCNSQSAQESNCKSFCQVQPSAPVTEGTEVPSDCAFQDSLDASYVAYNMGLSSHNLYSSLKSNNEKNINNVAEQLTSVDNFTWLDYLDQDILPRCYDMASQITSHDLCPSHKSNNEQNDNDVTGPSASMDNFTCSEYLEPDFMPKGDDVASRVDMLSNQGCATENVVQRNVSLQNDLNAPSDSKLACGEEACSPDDLIYLGDRGGSKSADCNIASQFGEKVAVKDRDAREVEHNSASSSHVHSVDSNLDSSSRHGVVEAPLQVKDSEILLLPYKEETSTTSDILKGEDEVSPDAAGCEQDFLDFDGFGSLFNELEPVAGPVEKPLQNGFGEATSAVGNCTESDPDEVDSTDAPVSVESCLACFTKPELLSKTEHAWQCENCAKLLQEQRIRVKKKLLKSGSGDLGNAPEDSNPRDIDLRATNESANKVLSDAFDDRLVYQNGTNDYSNCTPETSDGADQDLVPRPSEGGVHSSRDESCSLVNCANQNHEVQLDERSANFESGESENETDPKGVKVERDATKRILIDKAPPILTIHLKRFSQDSRGRLSKLSGHVNFRDTIDLTTFIDPRCLQKEVYKYRLVGVVEHSGTMRGGHYVAYVRGGPKIVGKDKVMEDYVWYYASDAYVREVTLEEVLQSEAYILFYEEI